MKLAVFGASGRMGQAVVRLAHAASDIQLVGAISGAQDPLLGRDVGELSGIGAIGVELTPDVSAGLLGAEAVIDFSVAPAVPTLFAAAEKAGVGVVSGTTGLDEKGLAALERAATKVPVVWTANMSLGVQVLAELVAQAVKRLGLGYDVEIVETHHRRKVDSPSGTAIRLADAARGVRKELRELRGRDGIVGARTDDEMAVLAIRGGDVIGDHTVHLLGQGERLELTHRATSRDLFAGGAIAAARFIVGKPPGRYTIADVLGG